MKTFKEFINEDIDFHYSVPKSQKRADVEEELKEIRDQLIKDIDKSTFNNVHEFIQNWFDRYNKDAPLKIEYELEDVMSFYGNRKSKQYSMWFKNLKKWSIILSEGFLKNKSIKF